jgi:Uncharacterized protein conserved in bacteria
MSSRLIVFSGLSGSGKTTIAGELAQRLGAAYLRIDTIERGLEELLSIRVQGEGYRLAYRIAADNLRRSLDVVADCVNPWELTRGEWEAVATKYGARCVNVEVRCSDEAEHRRRVETRVPDIAGLRLPTWEEVRRRDYQAWTRARILVETSGRSVDDCVDALLAELEAPRSRRTAEEGAKVGTGAPGGETDLCALIESMEPELCDTDYMFVTVSGEGIDYAALRPWAIVREREGTTLILERGLAVSSGLTLSPTFKRITLNVHSSLQAVGLTAAVAGALARAGISANVVAAYYHDHVFVPAVRSEEALGILESLSAEGISSSIS